MRKTAQKISDKTGSIVNTRMTHRNEPCPCGQEEITTYRAADGEVLKEHRRPVKFKNCCMNEQGNQANTQKSTEQLLKDRRSSIGWPMRDYLNTPVRLRGDFAERSPEPMGAIPRNYSGKNNKRFTLGRPLLFSTTEKVMGFTVLIREKEHNGIIGEPKFFEVKAPDLKMDKMPTRKMRVERLNRWYDAIESAKTAAIDYADSQVEIYTDHYYVVLPKIEKSSIKVLV